MEWHDLTYPLHKSLHTSMNNLRSANQVQGPSSNAESIANLPFSSRTANRWVWSREVFLVAWLQVQLWRVVKPGREKERRMYGEWSKTPSRSLGYCKPGLSVTDGYPM